MADRSVRLSLSDAERAHLASMGVRADERGVLHSASGGEVDAGTAALMLKADRNLMTGRFRPAVITPGDFRRGYIREGHAAPSAAAWITGIPGDDSGDNAPGLSAEGRAARTGPAGRMGPAGSGTADRDMDGSVAKDLDPGRFRRGYLAGGHAAESPANTGMRATVPVPESRPAEPQDFRRGWLADRHQRQPPGTLAPNNPHAAETPAQVVYETARDGYAESRSANRSAHVALTGECSSEPAMTGWAPPGAPEQVPVVNPGVASSRAPGETRAL